MSEPSSFSIVGGGLLTMVFALLLRRKSPPKPSPSRETLTIQAAKRLIQKRQKHIEWLLNIVQDERERVVKLRHELSVTNLENLMLRDMLMERSKIGKDDTVEVMGGER